jgi:hypothetical protein
MSPPEVREIAVERGILGNRQATYGSRDDHINMLLLCDARRGIYPIVSPHGFSRFHGMSQAALHNMTKKYGTCKERSKDGLTAFLLEKTPAVVDRSEEDTLAIVRSLLEDMEHSMKPTSNSRRLYE